MENWTTQPSCTFPGKFAVDHFHEEISYENFMILTDLNDHSIILTFQTTKLIFNGK